MESEHYCCVAPATKEQLKEWLTKLETPIGIWCYDTLTNEDMMLELDEDLTPDDIKTTDIVQNGRVKILKFFNTSINFEQQWDE